MGKANRVRRKAKQAKRQQRPRPGNGQLFGPSPSPRTARESPGELLTGAIHLRQCPDHDEDELPRQLEKLAAEPARPVDRSVMLWLQRAVNHAWKHGWQPADLVRVAHRRDGVRAARLTTDAIAAEMRGYAAATVDDRWAAQLGDLGITAWWEQDDGHLTAWSEREGLARTEALRFAVGVLAMLGELPPLPRLCPLPGAARPRAAARAGSPVDERLLDRVRALLAKAEATTFPEEAEAYTAKAQELMSRHSIDHALLAAAGPQRDEPAGRRLGVDNPYERSKALLLGCVAEANRCRAVWDRQHGFSTVMGFPHDLDAVELLYTSLLVQGTTAMLHEGSQRDRAGRSRTRAFRQSFLTAYATRIGERLRTATDQATREAATGVGRGDLLPVLAAREHEVNAAVQELFPGIATSPVRVTDRAGWLSGTAAADRASLGVRDQVTR